MAPGWETAAVKREAKPGSGAGLVGPPLSLPDETASGAPTPAGICVRIESDSSVLSSVTAPASANSADFFASSSAAASSSGFSGILSKSQVIRVRRLGRLGARPGASDGGPAGPAADGRRGCGPRPKSDMAWATTSWGSWRRSSVRFEAVRARRTARSFFLRPDAVPSILGFFFVEERPGSLESPLLPSVEECLGSVSLPRARLLRCPRRRLFLGAGVCGRTSRPGGAV